MRAYITDERSKRGLPHHSIYNVHRTMANELYIALGISYVISDPKVMMIMSALQCITKDLNAPIGKKFKFRYCRAPPNFV